MRRLKLPHKAWLFTVAALSAVEPAKGAIVTNNATSDGQVATNTWIKDFASTTFQIGAGASAGDTRAFLKFDLSNIPAGAAINAATLRLYESATNLYGSGGTVHRINSAWDTGTAGMTLYTNSVTSLGTLSPDAINSWATQDLRSTVSSWCAGSVSNYGLEVRSTSEGFTQTSRSYNSSRNGANKPQLIVAYTPGWASISNSAPTNVTSTSACLNGYLASTGTSDTAVFVFYGPTDGGTNPANWAATNTSQVSPQIPGTKSVTVTLPSWGETYYRYAASNAMGLAWATNAPGYLLTADVTVSVDPTAIGENSATATFTFARPATMTGLPLTVSFTANGSAATYRYVLNATSNVTIAGGATSATVQVTSVPTVVAEPDQTVALTVGPGLYTTGALNTATLTITNVATAATPKTWTGLGADANWSTVGNWSPASAPGPADELVFDGAVTSRSATVNAAYTVNSLRITNGYTGTITQNRDLLLLGDFTMSTGTWQFTTDTPAALTVNGNMFVGATVSCQRVSSGGNGTGRTFTVGGNLTVSSGGVFNANKLGFPPNGNATSWGSGSDTLAAGPGRGLSRASGNPIVGSGAGHGGQGGKGYDSATSFTPGGTVYGSIAHPTSLGSGGGWGNGSPIDQNGGGAIMLNVTGDLRLDGTVTCGGGSGGSTIDAGGGAGGSIWIQCNNLDGSGTISANGGTGGYQSNCDAGGGGGGRIAVYYSARSFNGQITAYGGLLGPDGQNNGGNGACGSVYLKSTVDPAGSMILNNNGKVPWGTTLVTSNVTETTVGHLLLTNSAVFTIDTNQSFTVLGSVTNFTQTNSLGGTLVLGGTNVSVFGGTTSTTLFYNLTCTNAGKTIAFPAGRTYRIQNQLVFAGADGNLLKLYSATGGLWKLTVPASPVASVHYVDVQYSDARGGANVQAYDSVDSAINSCSNWTFATSGGTTDTWIGAVSTNWLANGNWDLGRPPVAIDPVVISNGAAYYPSLNNATFLASLRVNSGATLNLRGWDLTVYGNAALFGTLAATGTETITFQGNVDLTGGTFGKANSTVVIAGTNAQQVTSAGNSFYRLTVGSTCPVSFVDAVSATLSVNVRSTNSVAFGGTLTTPQFTHDGGTLGFTGTVSVTTFDTAAGDLRFGGSLQATDFICRKPGVTLTLQPTTTYSITNLQWHGTSASKIVLRSATPTSAWKLNVSGWSSVAYVDVQDSDASGGLTIRPILSTNSGNNTNWDFGSSAAWSAWTGTSSANFTNASNWSSATAPGPGSLLLIDGNGANAPVLSSTQTVSQLVVGGPAAVTLSVNQPLTVTQDMTILTNGVLTHGTNNTTAVNRLTLTVGGNLLNRGAIDVTGKGFAPQQGPGAGGTSINGQPYAGSGGGHGGEGGHSASIAADVAAGGVPYGSITQPVTLGSGGGGDQYPPETDNGGGAVYLSVAGDVQNLGSIVADGNPGPGTGTYGQYAGGGSGGSIWLVCSNLTGTGFIRANGGWAAPAAGAGKGSGSGGGGRIAVYYVARSLTGSIMASAGDSSGHRGGAGTVYMKAAADPFGTLVIDNNGLSDTETTQIASNVTDTAVGDVAIRAASKLRILSNQTLTVLGSWTNSGTFTADTNSTLIFAGTNTATIARGEAYYNLTCTTLYKRINFLAGSTSLVYGTLMLRYADLRSTTTGTWWYLRVMPSGTNNVRRVAVQDSNATNGQTIVDLAPAFDNGHNVNWEFHSPAGSVFTMR